MSLFPLVQEQQFFRPEFFLHLKRIFASKACNAPIIYLRPVVRQVLYVLLEDHSPHVSGAAAVYLLAVVQRCRGHPVLAAYLPGVQAAFTRKLTVRCGNTEMMPTIPATSP